MSRIDWFCPLALAGAALCVLSACGGGDDDDEGDVVVVDSGPGAGDCLVPASLGSFDPLEGGSALHFTQAMDPAVRSLSVADNVSDSRVDLFIVELWDDYGPFSGDEISTGTFEIEGVETAVLSCGVCVQLLVNLEQDMDGNLVIEKQYIATEGTVTVDSIGTREGNEFTGNYSGSASGLVLTEIDPNDAMGGALEGGCQTTIDEVTWDAVIENGDD